MLYSSYERQSSQMTMRCEEIESMVTLKTSNAILAYVVPRTAQRSAESRRTGAHQRQTAKAGVHAVTDDSGARVAQRIHGDIDSTRGHLVVTSQAITLYAKNASRAKTHTQSGEETSQAAGRRSFRVQTPPSHLSNRPALSAPSTRHSPSASTPLRHRP